MEDMKEAEIYLQGKHPCELNYEYINRKPPPQLLYTCWETGKTFLLFTEPSFYAFGNYLVSMIMH